MTVDHCQQTFTIAILKENIQIYVQNLQTIKLKCQFRYPTTILNNISKKHIIKIIYYTILKHLNHFIIGEIQQKESLINNLAIDIRQYYYQMNVNNKWKQQFNFQFSIVYLVKIIANFCYQFFKQLETDIKFQGEIFIIIIHTFIGNNVGYKIYRILEKKYIGKSIFKSLKKKKFRKQSQSKSKSSTRKIQSIKIKTQTDQFKNQLFKSLYVQPLPFLQIKRKSLYLLSKNKQDQFQINKKLQQIQKNIKKKNVKSTQISSSMQAQLKKHNSQIAMYNKPFNINHRSPLNCQKLVKRLNYKNRSSNQILSLKRKQNQEQNRMQNKEWQRILQKMKNSVIEENIKIDFKSDKDKKHNDQQKIQQKQVNKENKNQDIQNNECLVNKKQQIKQTKISQIPLQIKIKKCYQVDQGQEYQLQVKNILPKSKQLKSMKRSFQKICQQRGNKIRNTIFALPGQKKIYNFKFK